MVYYFRFDLTLIHMKLTLRSLWLGLFSLLISFYSYSQTNIVPFGSIWKYFANNAASAPAIAWQGGAAFNDAAWPSGAGRLGFGDAQTTCIPAGCISGGGSVCTPGTCSPKFTTTYFRLTGVTIANPAAFTHFVITMRRDDGAVVYVNGQEVWRTNMPSGAIAYTTFASSAMDGANETADFVSPDIATTFFSAGSNNIVAVELHQSTAGSSDLGFDFKLDGITPGLNEVVSMWSGAVTPNSVKVNAKLTTNTTTARLVLSTSADLSSPIYGTYATANAANNRMAAMSATGLSPATKYYYAVEAAGIVDNSVDDIGSFSTPAASTFSYLFTIGSCSNSSAHPVWQKMTEKNPFMQVITGDFHYVNPNSAVDINVHRNPYENNILNVANTRNLFRNVPLAYVWDDHDYCGNDATSSSAGRTNARQAFQEYVPHYPLAAGSGNVPIYQSFVIGKVRFIMSDLRSERTAGNGNTGSTSPTLTAMGAAQKTWFKNELLLAKQNKQMVAWVTSISFGGNQSDNWGGFRAEREEIANYLATEDIENLMILSGDAHMSAIDDGTNHDFSTGAVNLNRYPVMSASGLNQNGSNKGGTYNILGVSINPNNTVGQYGVVTITDGGGGDIDIKFDVYRVTNAGVETLLGTYTFNRLLDATLLPLKLTDFTVVKNANQIKASWQWLHASPGTRMIAEVSADGRIYSPFDTLVVNHLDLNGQFTTTHTQQFATSYYRIKTISTDGTIQYSPVRIVTQSNGGMRLYPLPARDVLNLSYDHKQELQPLTMELINMTGQVLKQIKSVANKGINYYAISVAELPAGIYRLKLTINNKVQIKTFTHM